MNRIGILLAADWLCGVAVFGQAVAPDGPVPVTRRFLPPRMHMDNTGITGTLTWKGREVPLKPGRQDVEVPAAP